MNHEFEEETTVVTGGKNEIKSPCVRITQPSKDLNRIPCGHILTRLPEMQQTIRSYGKNKIAPVQLRSATNSSFI